MLGACAKRAPRIAQMYAFPLVSTPPVGSTSPQKRVLYASGA